MQWPRQSHGILHLQALRKTKSHLDGTIQSCHQFREQWFIFTWVLSVSLEPPKPQVAIPSRTVSRKPCGAGPCPALPSPRRDLLPSCALNTSRASDCLWNCYRAGSSRRSCSFRQITECKCTLKIPQIVGISWANWRNNQDKNNYNGLRFTSSWKSDMAAASQKFTAQKPTSNLFPPKTTEYRWRSWLFSINSE